MYTELNGNETIIESITYVTSNVPIIIPMIMFSIFILVVVGGYTQERLRNGRGNFPAWAAVAQLINSIIACIMLITPSLINIVTAIINVILLLIFGAWSFSNEED